MYYFWLIGALQSNQQKKIVKLLNKVIIVKAKQSFK